MVFLAPLDIPTKFFNDLRRLAEIPKDNPDFVQTLPRLSDDIAEISRDLLGLPVCVLSADSLGCRKDCITQLCPDPRSQTLWSFSSGAFPVFRNG